MHRSRLAGWLAAPWQQNSHQLHALAWLAAQGAGLRGPPHCSAARPAGAGCLRTLKAGSGPTTRIERSNSCTTRSTSLRGATHCSASSTGGSAMARKRPRVASTSGEGGAGGTSSALGGDASSWTAQQQGRASSRCEAFRQQTAQAGVEAASQPTHTPAAPLPPALKHKFVRPPTPRPHEPAAQQCRTLLALLHAHPAAPLPRTPRCNRAPGCTLAHAPPCTLLPAAHLIRRSPTPPGG